VSIFFSLCSSLFLVFDNWWKVCNLYIRCKKNLDSSYVQLICHWHTLISFFWSNTNKSM
jgi:hypothetical protein